MLVLLYQNVSSVTCISIPPTAIPTFDSSVRRYVLDWLIVIRRRSASIGFIIFSRPCLFKGLIQLP